MASICREIPIHLKHVATHALSFWRRANVVPLARLQMNGVVVGVDVRPPACTPLASHETIA